MRGVRLLPFAWLPARPIDGFSSLAPSVAYSPDGARLAVADNTGATAIIVIRDGEPEKPRRVPGPESGAITAVAFAGQRVTAIAVDGVLLRQVSEVLG